MINFFSKLEIKSIRKITLEKSLSLEKFSELTGKKENRIFLASMNQRDYLGRFSILVLNPLISAEFYNQTFWIEKCSTSEPIVIENTLSFKDALSLVMQPVKGSETEITPFSGLWAGFVSYNALRHIEDSVPLPEKSFFRIPDFKFFFSDTFIIEDHSLQETYLLLLDTNISEKNCETRLKETVEEIEKLESTFLPIKESVKVISHISKEDYKKAILKIQDYIKEGDVYQVNFAYPLTLETKIKSDTLFVNYLRKNPVDFAAYLNLKDLEILSISPECFFTMFDKTVKSYPIKGTISRGVTAEEDIEQRKKLINSEKDMAELSMIVDLIRNDLGKSADIGSVKVKQHASLETFHTLYHLYSLVQAKVTQKSRAELFLSMFPGGSITGAPKVRAMQIISELEEYKRNLYTGSIGWVGYNDDMGFNIAIRTIQKVGDTLYYFAGGGITLDSSPEGEFEETITKSKTFYNIFPKVEFFE